MVTDPVPPAGDERVVFAKSDALTTLDLPAGEPLQRLCATLKEALGGGKAPPVRKAGLALLEHFASFYAVQAPGLSVLGVRPHHVLEGHFSYELFGDYTPSTEKIRVWMRTAILGKVTSHRGLLNTLVHEFCHHLDLVHLGLADTPHTRGFYARVDALYHLCLGTPAEARMPLLWRKRGPVWVADWPRMRAAIAPRRP